jgi:cytochrome c-type biogenesis protein
MSLPAASMGFGFLAGILSILSPCVLPLLPMVLGPAASAGRFGLPALAAGLVVSFVAVGLFVANIGYAIGLDGSFFRLAAAVMLAGLGLVLLSTSSQNRFAMATGGLSNMGSRWIGRISPQGTSGQFVLGLLLGTVWSPCVGPTLGAASVLAAQGNSLGAVTAVMAAFGLGAAVPLLVIGSLSHEAMKRWRGTLMGAGKNGKLLLGGVCLAVALLILTGLDHRLETLTLDHAPAWLVDVTTRF